MVLLAFICVWLLCLFWWVVFALDFNSVVLYLCCRWCYLCVFLVWLLFGLFVVMFVLMICGLCLVCLCLTACFRVLLFGLWFVGVLLVIGLFCLTLIVLFDYDFFSALFVLVVVGWWCLRFFNSVGVYWFLFVLLFMVNLLFLFGYVVRLLFDDDLFCRLIVVGLFIVCLFVSCFVWLVVGLFWFIVAFVIVGCCLLVWLICRRFG